MLKPNPAPFRLQLLLAGLYLASGALALQLALPPGFVAPLFPPAGIALAAVLIMGWRALPMMSVASILLHYLAYQRVGLAQVSIPLLLTGASVSLLQAWAGRWLMLHGRVWPGGLDDAHAITRFVGTALLIPLISSVGALPLLLLSGATLPPDAGINTFNWWAGDALGILLFTPIVLALLARPRGLWQGRRRSLVVSLLAMTALLAGTLMLVRQREESTVSHEFERNAAYIADDLQASLQARLDMLLATERMAAIYENFSATDWNRFTKPWLLRNPGTQNLTWNPRVTRDELTVFQRRQQAVMPGYEVRWRSNEGNIIPVGDADEYFPITFAEPLDDNQRVVGLDPYSFQGGFNAINATRNHGRPAVSEPIRLAQETGSMQGVVVYQAVFNRDGEPGSGLRGLVSMALRIDNALREVHEHLARSAIQLCLSDPQAGSARLSGDEGCPAAAVSGMALVRQIRFGDREWQLRLEPAVHHRRATQSWLSTSTLIAALVFAGLLSSFLLLVTGRSRRIEALVAQRTTELQQASQRLREQKASLDQAQHIARIGSWEMQGEQLLCSEELCNILELPPSGPIRIEQLLARSLPHDRDALQEALFAAGPATPAATLDSRFCGQDGKQRILQVRIEYDSSVIPPRVRGTLQDVTRIREAEAHIRQLARIDTLTGLPNRSWWLEQARAVLSTAQRHGDQAAVLFLDLDNFKHVNDSLGHPLGDALLASVAQRLQQGLRAEDLLARQGGDEFVLLLPRLQQFEDIAAVATKLIQAVTAPFTLDGHELRTTVSIGIAHFPGDGQDIDTLLKHADVAMYSAKRAGRNNFQFFVAEMNQRATRRLQLETALRRAIERGELVLHYQPQLDLILNRITGVEALVRWQHPEQGMVPPGEFIPLAEETGLILPLGEWVMGEACRQQRVWQAMGLDLNMAINVAALQFQQLDLPQRISTLIRDSGISPERLELEITESALLGSADELVERLDRVRALGVSLSLDDFGTGYSCLAYLKRLPIERLKIDRSFIKDLPGDAEDAAIALATLSMASALGMVVVAEGVETQAQRDFLTQRGCHAIQGYLVSRPLPADAMTAWLTVRQNQSAQP